MKARHIYLRHSLTIMAYVCVLLFPGQAPAEPCNDLQWDTRIFRDDFTGPNGSPPDPDRWTVNRPVQNEFWWLQGRTFFPNPLYHTDGPFPQVMDGILVIEHYQYNPYHLGSPKTTFLGGEIHTKMAFDPTQYYRFEARVRWPRDGAGELVPKGLVASFFTYVYDEPNQDSDEIDFEFLSNEVFARPSEGDPQVLTNTWNDSIPRDQQVTIPELDLTEWNTFRMYWCPDLCVKWTWINPVTGDEILLREETDPAYVPDELMHVYFNFWAATGDWPKAYDAGLLPDQEDNGTFYEYHIDYVEVRVPESVPGDVDGNGWIDGTDLSIIIDNWGQSLGREFGDLNGNGVIDGPDYTEVLSNWYPEPPPEATPEPATLGLLLLGGLALLRRKR